MIKIPFEVKRNRRVSVGDIIPLTITEAILVYDDGSLRTFVPALAGGSLEVVEEGIAGDVSQSGVWDLEDVVLILRIVVDMMENLSPLQETLADADQNGRVEVRDALEVLRSLVKAKLVPGSSPEKPIAIDVPEAQILAGQRVSLPIQLDAADRVYGLDLRMRYNQWALRLEGISFSGAEGLMVSNTQTPGIVHIAGVNRNGFTAPDGHVADLVFDALVTGTQQVQLEQAQLLGADGENLPVRFANEMIEESSLPRTFALFQNYPNPFNPETVVRYELVKPAPVRIAIYNLAGQRLETLVRERQDAGRHEVIWQAEEYAPGVYLFVIEAGKMRKTMKMLLLK